VTEEPTEENSDTKSSESPGLQCFGGHPAPPDVVRGWQAYLKFTGDARQNFWSVLQPALADPKNPGNRDRVQLFCNDHGVPLADVVAAVRACDLLLRQAAALNLDDRIFETDLVALSDGDAGACRPLMTRFDSAKTQMRNVIIAGTLADHGKTLVGISWRTEVISASQRGMRLGVPVPILTLNWVEGEEKGRATLQLTPEALHQLKQFCDQMEV